MSTPERRKDPRARVWLPVKYHVLQEAKGFWLEGTVTDISAGGLRLACERLIEPGAMLEVEINVPTRPVPYVLKGHIRWASPRPSGTECGMMFVDVSPDQQFELDEIVQFLLTKRTRP